jgi:ATP-dependent exoDNAse (exonuclease V) beta subunit
LFQEIEAAGKRLHEVPYSYSHNGYTETGYIDLLTFYESTWTVVDFKTDKVQDEAALQRLLMETDYLEQVKQYGTAVQRLLGVSPVLKLCFLNFKSDVRVVTDTGMEPSART